MQSVVTLEDHMGSDLAVVNNARVSYGKRSTELSEADIRLLNYLTRERHGTPFERVVFTFHVKTHIAVAREWFRHRIASYNEISGRYREMGPCFFMPDDDAVRMQIGKSGHYKYAPLEPPLIEQVRGIFEDAYADAYSSYLQLLDLGVAKELARNVLPVGLMTEFFFTVNLRSLFNFLSLRTAPTAMREIRECAQEVERLATVVVPHCFEAWNRNGRQSI